MPATPGWDNSDMAMYTGDNEIMGRIKRAHYDAAPRLKVKRIVMDMTGADHVTLMGGQLRTSGQTSATVQPPAAEAHVDFNEFTSKKIAQGLYEKSAPDGSGYDRFIIFSLWRVISEPPQDWPIPAAAAKPTIWPTSKSPMRCPPRSIC